jgi:hypothetical protein
MLPSAHSAGCSAALVRYGVKSAGLELPLIGKIGPGKLMAAGALGSVLWDRHKHPQPQAQNIVNAPVGAY